jgi:cytochrome c
MKGYAIALAATLFAAGSAQALDNAAAQALMQKDGCSACHAGDKDAAAKLADKVKKGGSGVWGPIPMPPNAQVSDADIKTLVGWILTLKK